jgi:hypothetical protein
MPGMGGTIWPVYPLTAHTFPEMYPFYPLFSKEKRLLPEKPVLLNTWKQLTQIREVVSTSIISLKKQNTKAKKYALK